MTTEPKQVPIGGINGVVEFAHDDGFMWIQLWQADQRIAWFSMDYDIAKRYAKAILAETKGRTP